MSEEDINNSYIEMLIQDLEENSLGYWVATQDEMAKSLRNLQQENKELKDNWNKLKEWLEEEKIRLARECSNIYEDGLGKTKLVNEDIYNELNNVLDKMQEIEGVMNE